MDTKNDYSTYSRKQNFEGKKSQVIYVKLDFQLEKDLEE